MVDGEALPLSDTLPLKTQAQPRCACCLLQGCAALVVDGEALPLSGAPGLGPVEPPALAPSLSPDAAPGPSPALLPPEELPQLPPSPAPAPVEEVPAVGASPAPAPLPAPASPPPASPLLPAAPSPEQAPVAEVPSPPPSPPVCEPLPSTEVTVPDVTLKWVGDFSQVRGLFNRLCNTIFLVLPFKIISNPRYIARLISSGWATPLRGGARPFRTRLQGLNSFAPCFGADTLRLLTLCQPLVQATRLTGRLPARLQGMNSFAPDFGGDLERLLEQNITVLGPDPTAAPGATRTGVLMVGC